MNIGEMWWYPYPLLILMAIIYIPLLFNFCKSYWKLLNSLYDQWEAHQNKLKNKE